MKLQFERLEHQLKAIENIMNELKDLKINSHIDSVDNKLYQNSKINNNLKEINIKMETGTGKTFVYTKLMFELNKKYNGLFKFIIFTPSVAIKEGVKSFIESETIRNYFYKEEEYNKYIKLNVLNANCFNSKKGRRKIFPRDLVEFCETSLYSNNIHCLLINSGMLSGTSNFLKGDFDTNLISNISSPFEAVKEIRPIIIIDEPHRFSKDNRAYKKILELEPQLIFRFGATFPENENNIKYSYELNSLDAFNKGLVKGINVIYPQNNLNDKEYKIETVNKDEIKINGISLKLNQDLSIIDSNFSGITYIGKDENNNFKLSNGKIIQVGKKLNSNIYSESYQKLMIKIAINKHFEIERKNFVERDIKIKTLSLFFIDSVDSYRGSNNDGWLQIYFKDLLKNKLEELINKEDNKEYKIYLQESLGNIDKCCGGYFSKDNFNKEITEEEVDKILKRKNELISFNKENNDCYLMRFLFSKWTLKEGWDNPNVFVIAKLRSSGSENSKIQEVGRGLRLPVDETGRRISNEEFKLQYIIDDSEKDFADKLINEVNSSIGINFNEGEKVDSEVIKLLKENELFKDFTDFKIFSYLIENKIIDENYKIIDSNKLQELIPNTLKKGKITENKKEDTEKIKLNKNNWNKIKDLWLKIIKKYMIRYNLDNVNIEDIAKESIKNSFIKKEIITINNQEIRNGDLLSVNQTTNFIETDLEKMNYGVFLKELNIETSISVFIWNKVIVEEYSNKDLSKEFINKQSLNNIIKKYKEIFEKEFSEKYEYVPLNFCAKNTLYKNNDFIEEISKGDLGDEILDIKVEDNYLWNKKCYDSEIEKDILSIEIDNKKILVFGKLPKRSIKIPVFIGGTTTPDFIYVSKENDKIKLTLLVESKSTDLRKSEKISVASQEKFFKLFKDNNIYWEKITSLKEIEEVLNKFLK